MAHERLSSQDATLFCAQSADAPLQIGALTLYEAGPLLDGGGHVRIDALRQHIAARIDDLPRFRQRLVRVPLDLGRPVWADDEQFDIAEHVHTVQVPEPGGTAQLRRLVAGFLEAPLDPDRPLWGMWFVEGVDDDRVGCIVKASHVMADGMALLEFALTLLDGEPDPGPDEASRWRPDRTTATLPLLADAVRQRGLDAVSLAWSSLRALTHPARLASDAASVARAAASILHVAPRLSVTGAVGPHRDFAWLTVPLPALERVKRANGVTLNDVVLAITAGALRRYLLDDGCSVEGVLPRVLVPVSTHDGGTGGDGTTNRFSFFTVSLPVSVDDPVARLRAVHDQTTRAKQERQTDLAPLLFNIIDVAPVSLLRAVAPPALARQPFVNLAVTNLPGSPDPLYLAGARLIDLHPFITVTANIAVIIGVITYTDRLGVSVTVDPDVVPDLDALVAAIETSAAELTAPG